MLVEVYFLAVEACRDPRPGEDSGLRGVFAAGSGEDQDEAE